MIEPDAMLDSVMEDRLNDGAGNVELGNDCSEFDGEPDPAPEMHPGEDMDGDHASALASAGFGTDEDYGGRDARLGVRRIILMGLGGVSFSPVAAISHRLEI